MQKGAGPVRTAAVLLPARNRYVPGAHGVARVRYTSQLVLVPPRASPRRRSTRPGCENALPDAGRCWSRSHRGGAPTRAKLGTSSTSSMSGFDQTTKRQPALAPCPPGKKNPPAANSRGIVWSMARSAADFLRADQEACQCRQQPQGADHVPQEHEGQQDTHVSLEFDVREDPGCHTDGQGKAGKG